MTASEERGRGAEAGELPAAVSRAAVYQPETAQTSRARRAASAPAAARQSPPASR